MKKLKTVSLFTFILVVVITIGVLIVNFALSDIWHGTESNLYMEWQVIQLFFISLLLFLVSVFITLIQVVRLIKEYTSASYFKRELESQT